MTQTMVEWYSGDTEALVITVTEDEVAVDSLAGADIEAVIMATGSETALVSLVTVDFTIADNTATAYPDTSALEGFYTVEVQITDASGNVQTGRSTVRILKDAIE